MDPLNFYVGFNPYKKAAPANYVKPREPIPHPLLKSLIFHKQYYAFSVDSSAEDVQHNFLVFWNTPDAPNSLSFEFKCVKPEDVAQLKGTIKQRSNGINTRGALGRKEIGAEGYLETVKATKEALESLIKEEVAGATVDVVYEGSYIPVSIREFTITRRMQIAEPADSYKNLCTKGACFTYRYYPQTKKLDPLVINGFSGESIMSALENVKFLDFTIDPRLNGSVLLHALSKEMDGLYKSEIERFKAVLMPAIDTVFKGGEYKEPSVEKLTVPGPAVNVVYSLKGIDYYVTGFGLPQRSNLVRLPDLIQVRFDTLAKGPYSKTLPLPQTTLQAKIDIDLSVTSIVVTIMSAEGKELWLVKGVMGCIEDGKIVPKYSYQAEMPVDIKQVHLDDDNFIYMPNIYEIALFCMPEYPMSLCE